MKFFISFGLCLISSFVMLSDVAKAEQILLLNLQYKSDKTTTKEIHFYGNDINPNSVSINDRFLLTINGKSIQLPKQLYRRLDWLRRSFSYDSLSGGIQQPKEEESCALGGASEGIILKARYLTYKNSRIVASEMKPVFGLAQNCLFTDIYKPVNLNAQEDARAVFEILNNLSLLQD
ncbi:hypothetical protein NIES4101_29050 [Calothrix sp. NIES-4101]|nr:hypothetical protein NIES4101_29050 [Calothrix sp. NIES-4101]